jgi:hypothetical protein
MLRIMLWLLMFLACVLAARVVVKFSRRGPRKRYTSDRRQWWSG